MDFPQRNCAEKLLRKEWVLIRTARTPRTPRRVRIIRGLKFTRIELNFKINRFKKVGSFLIDQWIIVSPNKLLERLY